MKECSVTGCDTKAVARGYCHNHWRRWRQGKPLDTPIQHKRPGAICDIEGCGRKHVALGLCRVHWTRQANGYDLDKPVREVFETDDLHERLRHYAPEGAPDECWVWTRALNKGYGMIAIGDGKLRGAHIVAWELANDRKLPAGMVIRHSCDNPPCTNEAHLVLGTHADNVDDCVKRERRVNPPSNFHRTPEEVAAIRAAAAAGANYAELGRQYGCSRQAIARIAKGTAFTDGDRRRFSKAKLTDGDVREIRRLYSSSGMSQQQIADLFGIHQTSVSVIVRHTNWKHVD